MNTRRDVIFYCILVALTFISIVPLVLRGQHRIPQMKSATWPILTASKAHCGIDQQNWKMRCRIAYTPAAKALDGTPTTLDGFILPLESTPLFRHFLLSVRAPSCPYCPPGGPNELVEVFSTAPISWSEQSVSLRGILKLAAPENATGIFYQLTEATTDGAADADAAAAPLPATPSTALDAYRFADPLGKAPDVTVRDWADQPRLLSFWRADCAPCLEEMKVLPAIAKAYPHLPVLVISLQDAAHARQLPTLSATIHPLVARDDGRALLTAFGNDRMLALPYSVMLDATGAICGRQYGILTPDTLKEWRKPCNLAH